jgi:hypothetical protein
MTARKSTLVRWAIRFLVALACYAGVTAIWIATAVGWDRLDLFVAGVAFGAILLPSWCIAVAIEHFYVPNTRVRLIVHPLIVTILFVVISGVVLTVFFANPLATLWSDIHSFAFLALVSALLDASVDKLLESKLTPVPDPA